MPLRRTLVAVLLLGALLLTAAPASASSITGLTVANGSPSNGAGARTQYVVSFTTSASGALASGGTITVTFPTGTTFANFNSGRVFVGATQVGSCSTPNPTTTCTLFASIAPLTAARIEFNGITNPATAASYTLTGSTSVDTTLVTSANYTVTDAHQLATITVDNTSPSNGAGARTQYVIGFATTATGGLSSTGVSTIDVTFPTGTTFANFNSGRVFLDDNTQVGSCSTPNASRQSTCNIFGSIAASTDARIEFNGITNPTAPATTYSLTVATSSDPASTSSNSYTVTDAHTLSGITVNNSSPSNGAGARTQYVIGFTTTATGGLSATGVSTIDVTFPAGTTFANFNSGRVFVGTTQVGSCSTPNASRQSTCNIFGSIDPSTNVQIEFNGITNPATAANYALTVATSSDTPAAPSNSYTVTDAHQLATITVDNTSPSNGAGARTQYVIGFATTATGGLSSTGVSTIDVTFPPAPRSPTSTAGACSSSTTQVGSCSTPNASRQSTCNIFGTIGASTHARIEFNGITNPASGTRALTVATSSDTTPTTSQNYTVAAANNLTNVSTAPGSSAQSATTQYVIAFRTSATGGLSSSGVSTIDVTFPVGTTFANFNSGRVFVGTTQVGSCSTPNASRQSTCNIFGSIAASTDARIEFNGITNPPTQGNYSLTVVTSSDLSASSQYGIAQDTGAPETSIVSGPPATTTTTQPTLTFSSTEAGSTFQCRIDGAAFAACTSPFVAPPLAPGVHTFQVRSQDPAGNIDSTPASVTFTVTATHLSQPPTPTAGQTVVVSEAAGTVLVKAKGSNKFVALNADEGIPLGSTVDTTHGTVELTSQQKNGASQTAKFYDGIFLVTQQGSTINLTLTEKLAKCSSGKASAAAKKRPKKRRLWGDGKGHFRTKGKHSAATVVGTKWMVQDSCAGTLTKVARGVVSVRDFTKKKTIKVKAGKQYLAKPPK